MKSCCHAPDHASTSEEVVIRDRTYQPYDYWIASDFAGSLFGGVRPIGWERRQGMQTDTWWDTKVIHQWRDGGQSLGMWHWKSPTA